MFLSWKFCWFFVDAKIPCFWLPALKMAQFPNNIKLAYLCTQSICLVMSPAKHTCFIHRGLTKSYKKLSTIKTIKKNNWPESCNIGGNTYKRWNFLITQLKYTAKAIQEWCHDKSFDSKKLIAHEATFSFQPNLKCKLRHAV